MIAEVILIAAIVATACSIPGVFLVLRKLSLQSDAISHSVLFGIVISFFIVKDFESPLLMIGAAATGVLTVVLSELLLKTKLLHEDATIGLVFPVLFSIGVILISRYAGDIHLDTDAVLTGEIGLAPFNRMMIGSHDVGPRSAWVMGAIALLNILYLALFYKELKLSTFDKGLAAALGFKPALLHYGLMIIVSITAVGAFDSVGSILVVALMIAPAATAYMLTDSLFMMIILTVVSGISAAIIGVLLAFSLDTSISGTMAVVCGLLFSIALLFSPRYGIISKKLAHRERKWLFACYTLGVHLFAHENTEREQVECHELHLCEHLNWNTSYASKVIEIGIRNNLMIRKNSILGLTALGRETIRSLMNKG